MISVCMTTYNGAHFLREQLDSILHQLQSEDELLISDDGSTDGTWELLTSYSDKRIKLYQNNFRNPVHNFAFVMEHSRGEILALCDQDDIWLPNRRALMEKQLSGKKHSLLVMNAEIINAKGSLKNERTFERWRVHRGFWPNLLRNTYMGSSMAFTADLKSIILPLPKGLAMHDWWIGLLAEKYGQVILEEEPTLQYRIHGNNTSLQKRSLSQQLRWRWQLWRSIQKRSKRLKHAD